MLTITQDRFWAPENLPYYEALGWLVNNFLKYGKHEPWKIWAYMSTVSCRIKMYNIFSFLFILVHLYFFVTQRLIQLLVIEKMGRLNDLKGRTVSMEYVNETHCTANGKNHVSFY